MEQIITSLLDSDLYKFTMQQAVLELFPNAQVEYRFKNRGNQRFTPDFLLELKRQIHNMSIISLTDEEYSWIKENIPFFKPSYLEYLKNYYFDPKEIEVYLDEDNDLVISIKGDWHSTILWEVPLMALISELYFRIIDIEWDHGLKNVYLKAHAKHSKLAMNGIKFAEFGTRRRRSFQVQERVIRGFEHYGGFLGTSNVYFAMKFGVKPIGTMAHEWIMGISVLESLRHANYYALQNWVKVYNADLGIALTDTFGTPSFFSDFDMRLAKLYDGVRHDSGDPIEFGDKVIAHYGKLGINSKSKTIVFSDGLNVDSAIEIQKYFRGDIMKKYNRTAEASRKINASFGIGTHFTNDFEGSPALNMVIKLWMINGVHVVKLGDGTGKEMGEPEAVRVAKWTCRNTPLDVR